MISLTTKKRIIYLDQSFISNFAKLAEKELIRHQRLSSLLEQGVAQEKIVCPPSWFHNEETSLLDKEKEKRIHRYFGYLGQVVYKNNIDIRTIQFRSAALNFLGKPRQMLWKDIFKEDPDKRLRRFIIGVNSNYKWHDFLSPRRYLRDQLENIREKIKRNPRLFEQQLVLEETDAIEYFHTTQRCWVSDLFKECSQAYQEFLRSTVIRQIPSLSIESKMWSLILTGSTSRPFQEGDGTDIGVISTYLPYAHIFTTDTFMKHIIQQLKLDDTYGTKVFSSAESDLEEFCNEVETIISEVSPANVPLLTIILIPDDKIYNDFWNVCQKLASSRDFYENSGRGWIELVNVDDGKSPPLFAKGANEEIDIPFFMEFDDQISGEEDMERTKEKAIRMARSKKILFLDHYQVPSLDFVENVMKELGRGSLEPLGFKVVDKN